MHHQFECSEWEECLSVLGEVSTSPTTRHRNTRTHIHTRTHVHTNTHTLPGGLTAHGSQDEGRTEVLSSARSLSHALAALTPDDEGTALSHAPLSQPSWREGGEGKGEVICRHTPRVVYSRAAPPPPAQMRPKWTAAKGTSSCGRLCVCSGARFTRRWRTDSAPSYGKHPAPPPPPPLITTTNTNTKTTHTRTHTAVFLSCLLCSLAGIKRRCAKM